MPPNGLIGSLNGMLSGVLAYAGIQLFVEFLAEMRRPRDFIKAIWGAQFFIYSVYLVYGCVVYHLQGQYAFNPSYQGVSLYGWQTAGNMISVIAALIAGGLYGNIGIKVVYNNIFLDILKAPPLTTRVGKIIYAAMVPVWWILAYVIAAAIPDFIGFVSVISASMLLILTYSFPPLFALSFDIQKNAIRPHRGETFDQNIGHMNTKETTSQRLIRGFFAGGAFQVGINIWHVIYFLASLSMCGLGIYAAIEGKSSTFLHSSFQPNLCCRDDRRLQGSSAELILLCLAAQPECVNNQVKGPRFDNKKFFIHFIHISRINWFSVPLV